MNVDVYPMEECAASSLCVVECESDSPAKAWRTMDASDALLSNGMVYSRETQNQSHITSSCSSKQGTTQLAVINHESDFVSKHETETSRNQKHHEVSAAAECTGLEDSCDGAAMLRNIRPMELVRLLNSGSLGEVINEKQLYRHRREGPWIESSPKRIDLLKYIVWLLWKRESRRQRVQQRKRHSHVLTIRAAQVILERQEYRCALSGVALSPEDLALDHIVPVSEGGDFSAANAQFVSKVVNRAKHTMSQQEFILMCRRVAAHQHPPKPVSTQWQQRTLWD